MATISLVCPLFGFSSDRDRQSMTSVPQASLVFHAVVTVWKCGNTGSLHVTCRETQERLRPSANILAGKSPFVQMPVLAMWAAMGIAAGTCGELWSVRTLAFPLGGIIDQHPIPPSNGWLDKVWINSRGPLACCSSLYVAETHSGLQYFAVACNSWLEWQAM